MSLRVAPPPRVIEPPPETPAPATEYCVALEGVAEYVRVVSVPLDVLTTTKSELLKNSNPIFCPL